MSHIYSKIRLSQLLSTTNIRTPPFAIAHNLDEAAHHANSLGFPIIVKIDASSGGFGVFECQSLSELRSLDG